MHSGVCAHFHSWIDWLLDRPSVRRADGSLDARLPRNWWFDLTVLLAQLSTAEAAGVTSEMSGLATYLVGALVYYEHFSIATTLSVAGLLLLGLKTGLEKLATRAAPVDSHSRRVPASHRGHFAHTAQPGVRAVSHQSFEDLAGRRRGKHDFLWQLHSAEAHEGTRWSRCLRPSSAGAYSSRSPPWSWQEERLVRITHIFSRAGV